VYHIVSSSSQTSTTDHYAWMDCTEGNRKFLRLTAERQYLLFSTGDRVERYVYDPTLGYHVQIVDSDTSTGGSSIVNTRTLHSGGHATLVGTAMGPDSEAIFTKQEWACADRKGHCLVTSEFFDTTIGSPPLGTPLIFLPVGLG
jgi:hypothetical protein